MSALGRMSFPSVQWAAVLGMGDPEVLTDDLNTHAAFS